MGEEDEIEEGSWGHKSLAACDRGCTPDLVSLAERRRGLKAELRFASNLSSARATAGQRCELFGCSVSVLSCSWQF
jgi:hypothetical protein